MPADERLSTDRGVPPVEASAILGRCRDQLALGLAAVLAEGLGSCRDQLLDLAASARSIEAQDRLFSGQKLLAQSGTQLVRRFRELYLASFDAVVAELREDTQRPVDELALASLSLVDETEFEKDLVVSKLAARAAYTHLNEIMALTRRVAFLLGRTNLNQEDNPLHPKHVYQALMEAASELAPQAQVGGLVVETLDRPISGRLSEIYRLINHFLADNRVLPGLSGERPKTDRAAKRAASTSGGPAAAVPVNPGEVSFDALVQRLPLSPPRAVPQPRPPIELGYGAPAASPIGEELDLRASPRGTHLTPGAAADLLDLLTQLQRGTLDADILGMRPGELERDAPSTLHRLRAAPITSWGSPADAATIDIVAMLFDLIFSDAEVPDALRAQIGRLQIPVLKVALVDKTLFSNRRHPVRRFLDAVAGSAVGWSEKELPRLCARIADIVEELIENFEQDVGLFATQRDRLKAFLAAEEQAARQKAERLREGLERRDRGESARKVVDDALRERVARRELPPLVAHFADGLWRDWLTRAFVEGGVEGAAWRDALGTLDDLLWSVGPLPRPEDGHRLLTLLPSLRDRMHAAFAKLGANEAEEERFFSELRRLHVDNLRAVPRPVEPAAGGALGGPAGTVYAPPSYAVLAPSTRSTPGAPSSPRTIALDSAPAERSPPASSGPDLLPSTRASESRPSNIGIAPRPASRPGSQPEGRGDAGPARRAPARDPRGTAAGGPLPLDGPAPGRSEAPSTPTPTPLGTSSSDDSYLFVLGAPESLTPASQISLPASSTLESTSEPLDDAMRAAQGLKLGAWVEFSSARGNRRVLRLTWMSGFRGICLFTNRQGEDALSLPTSRLAARLRDGSARILSGERMTDRVVAKLWDAEGPQTEEVRPPPGGGRRR